MKISISGRKSKLVVWIMYHVLNCNLLFLENPSIFWCSLHLDFPRKRRTQARILACDSKVPIQGRCKIASPAWDFYSSCYLSICQTDLADSKSQHINNLSWKIESNPTHSTYLSLIWTSLAMPSSRTLFFFDRFLYTVNIVVYTAFKNKPFYVKEKIFICG